MSNAMQQAMNLLGQTAMPMIGAAVFPDTMTITAETTTVGSGGGVIKSGTSNDYSNVPVAYKPLSAYKRAAYADRLVSSEGYELTVPTHTSTGTRINLDPKTHKLVVNARTSPGDEPQKTFRIIAIGDVSGVVYEVVADREN